MSTHSADLTANDRNPRTRAFTGAPSVGAVVVAQPTHRIPDAIIAAVRARVDVVRVVQRHVQLQQQGSTLIGLCPFHSDRTPSFGVTPSKGIFGCFGCGTGGDSIRFLEMMERKPFHQVVRELAVELGVSTGTEAVAPTNPAPLKREPPAAPKRPPAAEVAAMWRMCVPITDDAAVTAWLTTDDRHGKARGLDAASVEDFNLARALPVAAVTPTWAYRNGSPWNRAPQQWRVVVPMFGLTGVMETLHARALEPFDPKDKATSPLGAEVRGTVLGDALGRLLLAHAPLGDGTPFTEWAAPGQCRVIIAEGVPDFLYWATRYGDAQEMTGTPPCWTTVIGVIAGSWTSELAARVPDGARVVVRTDQDAAGNTYAERIINDLFSRCDVRR